MIWLLILGAAGLLADAQAGLIRVGRTGGPGWLWLLAALVVRRTRGAAVLWFALILTMPKPALAQSIPALERAAGACKECAADGWTITSPTPDIIVGDGPWPGGGYTMSDIDGGPTEGSNMQLMLSQGTSTREGVSTTITGLVASQIYEVSFSYQSAKLASSTSSSVVYQNGAFVVSVGGTSTSFPTSTGDTWQTATITFTATSTTQPVTITIGDVGTGVTGGAVVADGATVRAKGDDLDGDGYYDKATGGTDCNDSNASIHPGAAELCNGVDDDCNGVVDDASTWYADKDGDGYGDKSTATTSCTSLTGYVSDATDCDDADATVHPKATETCDGRDEDCDGTIDEGALKTWYRDADADGYGTASSTTTACTAPSGYVADATDCNDALATVHPGATETCNGRDDDCDGSVDEDATDPSTWYYDGDEDGYGDPKNALVVCTPPSGFVEDGTDCDDAKAAVHPGAAELCNGRDDDCDGIADEDLLSWFYADADGDGYGNPGDAVQACAPPSGYVAKTGDCDDSDPLVNAGATEVCNEVDDDCDGSVDESTVCGDDDGDGWTELEGDCDDGDPDVNPDAPEVPDNDIDDDCDDTIDEDVDDTAGETDVDVGLKGGGCDGCAGGRTPRSGLLALLALLVAIGMRRVTDRGEAA